jgi:hypothetical protein
LATRVVAPALDFGTQELLQLLETGLARKVVGRKDGDEESDVAEHLVQLVGPVLADTDALYVLENLEGNAGDSAYRVGEPPAELADRAAVILIVKARVAQECVRRLRRVRCHALP